MVLHQHVFPRNHQVAEPRIPIILCIEPLLRPNISSLDSRNQLECLRVSDRDQKRMKTLVFPVYDQLSKNSCMGTMNPQISNPPLTGSNSRTINHKSFILRVIGSSSLKSLDIRSMTQLRLSITPQDLPFDRRLVKPLPLSQEISRLIKVHRRNKTILLVNCLVIQTINRFMYYKV